MSKFRSRRTRIISGLVAAGVGFVVAGGSAAIATGALGNGDGVVIQQLPGMTSSSATHWPTNANGQTYGSIENATSSTTDPDLVQAIATNGQTGYVYSSQLNPPGPSSPAQALAQQAAQTTPRYISVYAQDGTTVIGQFEVSEPSSEAVVTNPDPYPAGTGNSSTTTAAASTTAH